MPSSDHAYRSRAVRALVRLHDEHIRRFLVVWKQARAASVVLPTTDDLAYASLDTLLRHVLGAARGYMTWMCEVLELPDPDIRVAPEPAVLSQDPEGYLEHVLDRWRTPLQDVADDRLETPEYPSRWQTRYCIDAMLEHAVMHPIRHAFQLEELMRREKIVFRDAAVSDCEAVAALHALSWRTAYRGILAQDFLENVAEQDRLGIWRTRLTAAPPERQWVRVAVQDDQLVGFGCAFLDEDERWGALLDNLHVHPDCKGRGIGRQLMAQVAAWVIDRRPSSALHLWVLEENLPARGFYDRLGGAAVERVIHRAADDHDVPSLRYVWHQPSELIASKPFTGCGKA